MAKPSAALLSKAQSEIDTAVKKNLINKNTAARRKANLSKFAKDAGVKLGTAKKAASTPATAAPKKTAPKAAAKPATKAATKPAAKKAPAKKPAAKK